MKSSSGTNAAGTAVAGQSNVGRLDSHGNYIGFKGTEDLGNGLKAVFVYETAIGTDNGGAMSGGRDSYIGLAGGFGTVAAGNLTHPLRAMGAKVDLLPGAAGFGTTATVTGQLAGIKTGADDRAANAVAYISPSFSGFSATVAYVNGETKTTTATGAATGAGTVASPTNLSYTGANAASKAWQVAGQYENGPLFAALGYHKATAWNLTAAAGVLSDTAVVTGFTEDGQDARIWRAAAVYSLPTGTKLTALYDNTKVELGTTLSTALGVGYIKRTAWSIGAAQSFGQNTVGLQYAKSGDLKTSAGDADGTSSKIVTLLYSYNLSKRTMLHARYSKLNNDEGVNANFYNLGVTGNGGTSGFGSDYTGMSVGVRHSF